MNRYCRTFFFIKCINLKEHKLFNSHYKSNMNTRYTITILLIQSMSLIRANESNVPNRFNYWLINAKMVC